MPSFAKTYFPVSAKYFFVSSLSTASPVIAVCCIAILSVNELNNSCTVDPSISNPLGATVTEESAEVPISLIVTPCIAYIVPDTAGLISKFTILNGIAVL